MKKFGSPVQEWLAPLSLRGFVGRYWKRAAFFRPGSRKRLRTLAEVFPNFGVRDLLKNATGEIRAWHVAADGETRSLLVSPTLAAELHQSDWTVYFDLAHAHPYVKAVMDDVSRSFGHKRDRIRVSVFASRKRCKTLRHVDFKDNLTIQLSGRKRWRLSPVGASGISSRQQWLEHLGQTSEDTIPFAGKPTTVEMRPGSILYCPGDWLHETVTLQDSVSLNICLDSFTWIDLLASVLPEALVETSKWNDHAFGLWGNSDHQQRGLAEFLDLVDDLGPSLESAVIQRLKRESS